jgi:hypothetical protein
MKINEKNSSIYALILGILSAIWIFLLSEIALGVKTWTKSISFAQWGSIALISTFGLVILGILAIFFGVNGILKAIKGEKIWLVPSIIGILLAVLPFLFGLIFGAQWIRLMF